MRCRGELTETGARLPGQLESEGRAAPVCILLNNNYKLHPALVHCVDAET